ncbi:MAG: amidohydrolase family protein [Reyranellaceae bacterium]
MNGKTILIRGGTAVVFDGRGHSYLEDGEIDIAGDRITYLGPQRAGVAADQIIDATGKVVIPGLISSHAHVGAHEGSRLLLDSGQREFIRSGFLHFLPTRRSGGPGFLSPQDARASLRYGFATMLRNGVTSALAFAPAGHDGGALMREVAAEFGIRLVWTPIIQGGRYWLNDDGSVDHEDDEAMGLGMLEKAVRFIEHHRGANDGRLSGVIAVDEFYASTPRLRQAAKKAANDLGVPFTLHFVEQHREFFETMSKTARTPVQLLADENVLDRNTILAHCIYIAGHSLVGYPLADDIGLLGQAGASVAHSPVAFSRRGVALESFDRYRKAGVNVALATDAYPLDLFAEMRTASIMCKAADRNYEAAPAPAVFDAATLAGAAALGRDDIGRIAPGARADLVIVDPRTLAIGPNPDPVRMLVHLAGPDNVDLVMVGGRVLVEDGRLTMADEQQILADAAASSNKVWAGYGQYHPKGRDVAVAFPPSYPTFGSSP